MRIQRILNTSVFLLLGLMSIHGEQEIDLHGSVLTLDRKPIPGATVTLLNQQVSISTDSLGKFHFASGLTSLNSNLPSNSIRHLSHGLYVYLDIRRTNQTIQIQYFNAFGKKIGSYKQKLSSPGTYRIDPFVYLGKNIANGIYFARIKAGSSLFFRKAVRLEKTGYGNGNLRTYQNTGISNFQKINGGGGLVIEVEKTGFNREWRSHISPIGENLTIILEKDSGHAYHELPKWNGTDYAVHEWGTFVTVQGSDGVVLDGLVHEDEDLPDFVYDLRDLAGVTGLNPKMETPVIYFYSPDTTSLWISVNVNFPNGIITQWYPAASAVNHVNDTNSLVGLLSQPSGKKIEDLSNGYIVWGSNRSSPELVILPPDSNPALIPVDQTDPWRFSRQVDANTIRVCNQNAARLAGDPSGNVVGGRINPKYIEYEKSLFYRGLGNFQMPLTAEVFKEVVKSEVCEVSLTLKNTNPNKPLIHLFIIKVIDGKSGFHYLTNLITQHEFIDLSISLGPIAESTTNLVHELADRLVLTGLFWKEALAMARTWQQGYFQDEGLRVLYVLPRSFIDQELPLKFGKGLDQTYGKKFELVRTFVGRTELISPEREKEMQQVVHDFAFGNDQERETAVESIKFWGRFSIPYLNRVKELTTDEMVIQEVNQILAGLEIIR